MESVLSLFEILFEPADMIVQGFDGSLEVL